MKENVSGCFFLNTVYKRGPRFASWNDVGRRMEGDRDELGFLSAFLMKVDALVI